MHNQYFLYTCAHHQISTRALEKAACIQYFYTPTCTQGTTHFNHIIAIDSLKFYMQIRSFMQTFHKQNNELPTYLHFFHSPDQHFQMIFCGLCVIQSALGNIPLLETFQKVDLDNLWYYILLYSVILAVLCVTVRHGLFLLNVTGVARSLHISSSCKKSNALLLLVKCVRAVINQSGV